MGSFELVWNITVDYPWMDILYIPQGINTPSTSVQFIVRIRVRLHDKNLLLYFYGGNTSIFT